MNLVPNIKNLISQFIRVDNILLFLMALELFNKHHYIILLLFIWLILKKRVDSHFSNGDFVLLVVWSLIYWLFTTYQLWSILQVPTWVVAFIIGYSLVNNKKDVSTILLMLAIGYGLEGWLTVHFSSGMDLMMAGATNTDDRAIESFWSNGTIAFSAINVSFYLFSGLLVSIFLNKSTNWGVKLLACIFELGFVYVSVRAATRSSFIICPLIIASTLLYYGFKNRHGMRVVNIILIVGAVFLCIFLFDIFGVRTLLENTGLYSRFIEKADGGVANNSRFGLHDSFWIIWTEELWGGLYQKYGYYFHNTWMDMHNMSGILSATLFLLVTIRFIRNFVYATKHVGREEQTIHVGTFLAFMLPFYMDPMLWAAPAYFVFFCMYYGMLSKRCDQIRNNPHLFI